MKIRGTREGERALGQRGLELHGRNRLRRLTTGLGSRRREEERREGKLSGFRRGVVEKEREIGWRW
eukprot:837157-Amorphochlora_amoeboformis.AAC.1